MSQQRLGQLIVSDYFNNVGGLNLSDSVFATKEEQATGGSNYDYAQTGGIKKRRGHENENAVAFSPAKSSGLGFYNPVSGTKSILRAAGTKLQNYDRAATSVTNLTEDTTAVNSDFLNASSTIPVTFSQFNTTSTNVLWAVGSGAASIYGMYSLTKVTKNGADVPTGTITATTTAGTGTFPSVGTYRYAISIRKASTQVESNAVFHVPATIAATTNHVVINLATLTVPDTTKYDQINIWRSAVNGAEGFTTGDLIAQLSVAATSYTDTGSAILSSQVLPRSGSLVLDYSTLPSGTYKTVVTWKRRLVTASGSTLYFSELNQPEAWPTLNRITIPSGGDITALSVISFSTDFSTDEYLVIFKENECWVVVGEDLDNWSLSFIDNVGCAGSALPVVSNGLVYWISSRGIYMFDGSNKPVYLSRLLEPLFEHDGSLDLSKIHQGFGVLSRKLNQIQWYVSDKTVGDQKVVIKLDLRLTLPSYQQTLNARIIDGVFMLDSLSAAMYAGVYYVSTIPNDVILLGDDAGFIYEAFVAAADGSAGIDFQYSTKFMDMGNPNMHKRFHKVIVWVEEVGDWELTLDYWTGYKGSEDDKSFISQQISTAPTNATALWDLAFWDVAYWDSFLFKLKPLVFNLNSSKNNAEGECLRLRFRNNGADEPVTIAGYSVVYSEIAQRQ